MWLILLVQDGPGATATVFQIFWSVAPYACLAFLAVWGRKARVSSWTVLAVVVAAGGYNCLVYCDTYRILQDPALRNGLIDFGLCFVVLGFGLYIEWPAVALTAVVVVAQRIIAGAARRRNARAHECGSDVTIPSSLPDPDALRLWNQQNEPCSHKIRDSGRGPPNITQ
jgi:hypothetical protein